MRKATLLVLCVILALSSAKLLFVSEAYRHGARGSLSNFYDGKNQSDIAGQLTATGQRQHFNFGQILRNEYVNNQKFMSEHYNYTEIYVKADDCDRTIMSALSHFQGFYPETFGAKLPENLPVNYTFPPFSSQFLNTTQIADNYALPHGIQVLPVHITSEKQDFTFLASKICLNYPIYVAEYMASHIKDSAYVDLHMAKYYLELSVIFKKPIAGWLMTEGLHDTLISDVFNGRPIPKISEDTWNAIRFLDDFYWTFMQSGSMKGVKLMTQPMMEEILEKFDAAISGSSPLKWLSFSGHDSNVAPLLRLLNFTSHECLMNQYFKINTNQTYLNCVHRPAFAASVLFELHQDDKDATSHFVKVRYNGEYMNICEKENTICDYNEFKERLTSQFAQDYKKECGIQNLFSKHDSTNYAVSEEESEQERNLVIIVAIQLVALIGLGWWVFREKKQSKVLRQVYAMPMQQQIYANEVPSF